MRTTVAAIAAGGLLLSAAVVSHADPKSDALFAKAKAVAAETRSLQAELDVTMKAGSVVQKLSGSIKVLKPGMWELRGNGPNGQETAHIISDGKAVYNIMASQKQYLKSESGSEIAASMGSPAASMILGLKRVGASKGARYLGKVQGSGRQYDVVQLAPGPGIPEKMTVKYFFGPSGLPEGQETMIKMDGLTTTSFWLRKLQLNPELAEKEFAYTPPADYKLFEPDNFEAGLLAVDKEAPDFLLPQPGGGTQLALSDARKGKKAVLVNFWFYG